MIVRVRYDGGLFRLHLQPSEPLSVLIDELAQRAPHYRGGHLCREQGGSLRELPPQTSIGDVLEHGEMLIGQVAEPPTSDVTNVSPEEVADDTPDSFPDTINDSGLRRRRVPRSAVDPSEASARTETPATVDANAAIGGAEARVEDNLDLSSTNTTSTDRMCRICHEGDVAAEELGRLFSPCLCRGSVRFVHIECLNEWRRLSSNPNSYYECETCKYRYSLQRTQLAELFLSRNFVVALTAFACLVLTMLCAIPLALVLPRYFSFNFVHHIYRLSRFRPRWHNWRSWAILAHTLDFLGAGISGLGCIGFFLYLLEQYYLHRDDEGGLMRLGRHLLSFAALSNDSLARIVVIIGILIAYRHVFTHIRKLCTTWSQKYGEKILQVSNPEEADDTNW